MSNPTVASMSTRVKVGLFTIAGLLFLGGMTVYVSHRPYWYRNCQLVHIRVDDATGLKSKSPVRSLGLEIGYLQDVDLMDTSVSLGICVTAPVEVLPNTKAYIRTDGILGDKFVELKPVRYLGPVSESPGADGKSIAKPVSWLGKFLDWGVFSVSAAQAADRLAVVSAAPTSEAKAASASNQTRNGREIPVGDEGQNMQQLMGRMDELVGQMTGLANNLKTGIDPEELRRTMRELNRTLENASKALAPEGGLNQTAQRTLAKLEDGIEQLRDLLTRVNKGEGSVGMLLNDPTYAEELREAVKNLNRFLTKMGDVRFIVSLGAQKIMGYEQGRGAFELGIWPRRDRYYLIGITVDPRGQYTQLNQTTTAGGVSTAVQIVQREPTGFLPTAMLGKVFFKRVDLSLGVLYGDGALSLLLNLGWSGHEDLIQLRSDVYTRFGDPMPVNARFTLILRPFSTLFVRAGLDGLAQTGSGPYPFNVGAGVSFDDEDIRLLFTFL